MVRSIFAQRRATIHACKGGAQTGKAFPRYDQKVFLNVVTDDESWIHYFELHRKISEQV